MRPVGLTDGAFDPRKVRRIIGEQVIAFLKKRSLLESAQLDESLQQVVRDGTYPFDWAVTPAGIQVFFSMNTWAARGDGTVYALVRREVLAPLYRPESALGRWARAKRAR
jgi:hypothetical protein